jgi:hypothetical protein
LGFATPLDHAMTVDSDDYGGCLNDSSTLKMATRSGKGGAMRRLVMLVRFQGHATPPEGEPARFSVRGESDQITLLDGDGEMLPERAAYETQVTITGESSFVEHGTMTFDSDADRLRFTTVGEGTLVPSAEQGVLQGSVIWTVGEGAGQFSRATGLITSSFTFLPDSGEASEHQVLRLFLP